MGLLGHILAGAPDPLIWERRQQARARGEDPFLAVDLPEMLIRLKQGAGRLVRSVHDRGVLALLDLSYEHRPWREAAEEVLPEGAEVTCDLKRVAAFCPTVRKPEPAPGEVEITTGAGAAFEEASSR